MKFRRINPFRYAIYGIAGIALASSLHAAVVFSNGFEGAQADITTGGVGYVYYNQDGWTQATNAGAVDKGNYYYDSTYDTADRPDPFGTVALHAASGSDYTYRDTGLTFVSGQRYQISLWASSDTNIATSLRTRVYIADSAVPFDGNSLTYADFRADGTGGEKNAAAENVSRINHLSTDVAGNWQLQSFEYVATGADDGKDFYLGVWLDGNGHAIDNVEIQTIPEPGSLALLGLGALAAFRRRRN